MTIKDKWYLFKLELEMAGHRLRRKVDRPKALAYWRAMKAYRGNNEFHPLLDIHGYYMSCLTEEEQDQYLEDLVSKRQEIHFKDCNNGRVV